ncbi:hypothetical protein M0804_006740 [Polistes exclamans]|nr:hypothetical protein M0804_006740 [Polistes exclamans]
MDEEEAALGQRGYRDAISLAMEVEAVVIVEGDGGGSGDGGGGTCVIRRNDEERPHDDNDKVSDPPMVPQSKPS